MVLSDSVLYISGTLKAKKKHLLSFSARGIKDRSKATSFAICPFCFPFTALRAGCGHGLGTQGWRDMLGSRCRIHEWLFWEVTWLCCQAHPEPLFRRRTGGGGQRRSSMCVPAILHHRGHIKCWAPKPQPILSAPHSALRGHWNWFYFSWDSLAQAGTTHAGLILPGFLALEIHPRRWGI